MSDSPLLEQARAIATRLGHDVLASEHVLLAVIGHDTTARTALESAAVDLAALTAALESGNRKVRPRGEAPAEGLPLSSHARRLLDGVSASPEPGRDILAASLRDRRSPIARALQQQGAAMEALASALGVPILPPPPPGTPATPPAPPEAPGAGPAVNEPAARPERRKERQAEAARQPGEQPRDAARAKEAGRQKEDEKQRARQQGKGAGAAAGQPREGAERRRDRGDRPEGRDRQERRDAARAPRPGAQPEAIDLASKPPSVGKLAPPPRQSLSWWRFLLLAAVPAAIVLNYLHQSPVLVFVTACVGVLPLAGFMGEATEHIAARTGPALGGLLNATFGNAAELIIAIVALRAGLIELVKASIIGSILGNLLLIMGLSLVAGGITRPRLRFSRTNAGMSAGMLCLAVVSLVLPTLFAFIHPEPSSVAAALYLSEGIAAILLVTYAASLWFSLRTHRRLFGGDPHPIAGPLWGFGKAAGVLALATVGVAVMSEILVHSVEAVTASLGLSQIFLGLIVIPFIGNAAEHATAVVVARKGQMDLSLQIALGSSTQIALLVAPVLVFVGLAVGQPMNLVFRPLEVVVLFLATLVSAIVTLDGESNWFEGVQLLAVYAMIATAAYFI